MRQGIAFLLIISLLAGCDVVLARRLILPIGGGSFTSPARTLYCLFNGQNGDGEYKIFAATYDGSTDTWTEYVSNPVLVKGSGGAWDDDHVKDPNLIWDGSQYVLFFAGYDGTKYQVGVATASAHTGTWTKDGGNPVIAVGSGGSFDDAGVNFPTVLYEPADTGKEWKVWYAGNDGSVQTIGYAYASAHDGPYTKVGQVLTVGSGGTWEDEGVLPMAIVKDGPTYYLFYGGRQGAGAPSDPPQWQGGLVTFTDPEGTYTKDAGNPTLLARFNDSGTSVVPTADVTAGATTVALSDTSTFNIGEPIAIADGDTTAHIGYIASIDSGTQVTLDAPVVGNFTGGGKVFRSFAYNSVLHRSVLPAVGGGWETFGTPFQPVDDLTQPAPKLWEGSFRWTGATLDGEWAYDYVAGRGLLFPFSVSAHSRSAENPSVIRAP
jgi:hypothetical protein